MDLLLLPPPHPARNTGSSAQSDAAPLPAREGEESDDFEATLTDNQRSRRQASEGEKKRAQSPSVESEDTMPLQRRPRVAARKQHESAAQQGKGFFGPVRLSEFWRNLDGLEECWMNL